MNIIVLTFDYVPHPAYGSGVYVGQLTQLLRARHHEVKIITVNKFGAIHDKDAIFCDCIHEKKAIELNKCVCTFGEMGCFEGLLKKAINILNDNNFIPDILYVL